MTDKTRLAFSMLHVPLLWPSICTPTEEIAAIKNLHAHLNGLKYSVVAWEAALLLYQTSKTPPSTIPYSVANRWRWIACNECVLELYHLRSRLGKIVSVGFQKCPSVRSFVDFSKLREARKKLDELFPDIEKLRHAIAHKGENEAHSDVHATDGQYALTGFREPDRFSVPYEGQLRYLDITMQSLQKIEEVVFDFLAAFKPAAVALEQQGHLD